MDQSEHSRRSRVGKLIALILILGGAYFASISTPPPASTFLSWYCVFMLIDTVLTAIEMRWPEAFRTQQERARTDVVGSTLIDVFAGITLAESWVGVAVGLVLNGVWAVLLALAVQPLIARLFN